MSRPHIGIILTSTRASRFGERPAKWILEIASARGDADYELVDLRDYPIPFFDAPGSPRFMPATDAAAQRWAERMASLDGYVFVTAEYNRSITGVLKNALDHLYYEPGRKPAAFAGYGAVGGARAVEQLRLMCIELGMAPMKSAVHIGMEPMLGMLRSGKDFADYDYLAPTVTVMLDELSWWAEVLKTGRDTVSLKQAA